MSNKLYVGGLRYNVDNAELGRMFASAGTVLSAKVIVDRDSGRSRGFGFVEMSNASEAQEAIKQLNGTEIDGHAITVNEAKPQRERGGRSGGGGYNGGFRGGDSDRDRSGW